MPPKDVERGVEKEIEEMNDMIKMEGGQEAVSVKKRFLRLLVKSFKSQSEKSEMWKKKSNDKNRFILKKEIVEKK